VRTAAAIVDAGPLIAFFDKGEQHHGWVRMQIAGLDRPLLTCEPVLTEAMLRLRRLPIVQSALFALLEKGALQIAFHLEDHLAALMRLHDKYRDRPMSLADACIVKMAELNERHAVFTLDLDFAIYRKHGREPLTVISPPIQ
jgi:predicted nucleic acid-binding protein